MKNKLIIVVFIIILLTIAGCTKGLDVFKEEKEHLTNEILELESIISKKDKEISHLEKTNSDYRAKISELSKSQDMIKFSSYARLNDYNDTFENLRTIYKIDSNYMIKDDWYIINGDNFQIELLGYEKALKVDFYTLRMESDQGPILVFSDTDHTNGWVYTNDDISEIINKHRSMSGGFTYEPYFLIYAEVKQEDESVLKTPKLPIYNK